ncbi:MAG: hydrogenase nickel incorporation protein HypA [Candidatus Omnitrophica bacterium]|nr:hydrogenase nickel incorporation protein HypA [Candidatus Omnitrophota bacterium]
MHEWALAEAVVLTAEKVAKEQGLGAIQGITIKLGQLQQIEKNILKFAIREIIQHQRSLFKKAKIRFQNEKAVFKCRNCGRKWNFANAGKLNFKESEAIHFVPEVAHVFMSCPQCKSPDFEIIKGRGIWVDSIVGEKEGPDGSENKCH